jgi:flagellar hook protein FlgE
MLGSIYVGLSGMNAFSKGLQTISNNVANMNSLGFKATSVNFANVFNTGGLGSSYSGQGRQSGGGVRFNSLGLNFGQGEMRSTGGDLDLAVQGAGFLTLTEGGQTYYARTGQFAVGEDGYIVSLGSKYRLNVFDGSRRPQEVNVDLKRTSPPVETTKITLDGYVGGVGVAGTSTSKITVYDSSGVAKEWTVTISKGTEANAKWKVSIKDALNVAVGEEQELEFNGMGGPIGGSTLDFIYTDSNGQPATVELDCSLLQNIASPGGIRGTADGSATGTLVQVAVNDKGELEATYSNGKKDSLGAVVLADFRDPQTLEQLGNGVFRSKGGTPRLGQSEQNGLGKLTPGQVEASNVDLSQQFGDLILIQRGFQASSQVVSVSNDMIQQLFGIRGQG